MNVWPFGLFLETSKKHKNCLDLTRPKLIKNYQETCQSLSFQQKKSWEHSLRNFHQVLHDLLVINQSLKFKIFVAGNAHFMDFNSSPNQIFTIQHSRLGQCCRISSIVLWSHLISFYTLKRILTCLHFLPFFRFYFGFAICLYLIQYCSTKVPYTYYIRSILSSIQIHYRFLLTKFIIFNWTKVKL